MAETDPYKFTARVLFKGESAQAITHYAHERGLPLATAIRLLAMEELARLGRVAMDEKRQHKKMFDQQVGGSE